MMAEKGSLQEMDFRCNAADEKLFDYLLGQMYSVALVGDAQPKYADVMGEDEYDDCDLESREIFAACMEDGLKSPRLRPWAVSSRARIKLRVPGLDSVAYARTMVASAREIASAILDEHGGEDAPALYSTIDEGSCLQDEHDAHVPPPPAFPCDLSILPAQTLTGDGLASQAAQGEELHDMHECNDEDESHATDETGNVQDIGCTKQEGLECDFFAQ
jgi:hypothetical protein